MGFVLPLSIFLAGCKPAEKPPEKVVVVDSPSQITITGQMFIVTKGRENVVLGDETVSVIGRDDLSQYCNSRAEEWKSNVLVLQSNIDADLAAYNSMDESNINKLAQALKYWSDMEKNQVAGSDEYENSSAWESKVRDNLQQALDAKNVSDVKLRLDQELSQRETQWEEILHPAGKYIYSCIGQETTDSEGRFKFTIDHKYADTHVCLLAQAERDVPDGTEKYWWLVDVDLVGKDSVDVILSNDNEDRFGMNFIELLSGTNSDWFINQNDAISKDDIGFDITNRQNNMLFGL